MAGRRPARRAPARFLLGIGAATAAAHIGNNFTTYLIGGLIDRFGFTPVQMGAWSMAETLSYAAAMFLVAPRVATMSPRLLLAAAGGLAVGAQGVSALLAGYPLLLLGRVATGFGFGLANSALNLAAGRAAHPARAISVGIAFQTLLYALINIALPMVGARHGVAGMFLALAGLSLLFTLPAVWLPAAPPAQARTETGGGPAAALGDGGARMLSAMALFTFGSLAIWPFMERAAHAIGIPAIQFGRYQSAATLLCALGNMALGAVGGRLPRAAPLAVALLACGGACAALTLVASAPAFALALIVYNMSWFITYPLLLGIAYGIDRSGRLPVLCSAVWLAMMSLGSLVTGIVAQLLGGYGPVGPMGCVFCLAALLLIRPIARRMDGDAGRAAGGAVAAR